jgi:hypothetical protein
LNSPFVIIPRYSIAPNFLHCDLLFAFGILRLPHIPDNDPRLSDKEPHAYRLTKTEVLLHDYRSEERL